MRKGFKYMCKFPGLEIPVWYEGHVMLSPACDPKRYYTGRYFTGTPIKIRTLDGRIRTGRAEGLESIELIRRRPYFRIGDVVRINTTYNVEYVLKITELFIDKFNNFITAGHNPNFEMSDVIKIKESQRYYWVKGVGYIWIPLDEIKSFEVL